MTKLQPSTILGLHEAGVSTGLAGRRAALLSGIDPRIAGSLETQPDPASQLLADLNALNQMGRLADGTVPMESLLRNAAALVGPRAEAAVFDRALVELLGAPVAAPSPAAARELRDVLRDLRSTLADLYARRDIARVATDAGLNPARLDLEGAALMIWHNVLEEARKQVKLRALVAVARSEYADNAALARLEAELPRDG